MASYFFDTSALVKYYHDELGSEEVRRIFAEPDRHICLCTLGLVELHSALAKKVRTGALSEQAAKLSRDRLQLDIAAGQLLVYTVDSAHYVAATDLLNRYAFRHNLRTLDALQLAVALKLFSRQSVDCLVTADAALADVARAEGVPVRIPVA